MSCDLLRCDLSSRNQWKKLLVSVYGYWYLKLTVSITTNELVHFGVISMENVSLEELVGSHFPLWIVIFPPNIPA